MISVSTEHAGGLVVVAVSGEIDLATGPVVAEAIAKALTLDGVESVRVDINAVRFLDSSGIALLLKARRDADGQGVTLRVVGASGIALQVLELTGVWEHLRDETITGQP